MFEKKNYPPFYSEIVQALEDHPVYLVGGTIRDLLLGKDAHDLDFALPSGTFLAAKKIADHFDGDLYILDPEREAVRVILYHQERTRMIIDFTRFRGETIQEDLRSRDFTITSMGVSIHRPDQLLDPCGGQRDLQRKVIRSCTKEAFIDDPLRAVRAVRMAAQLGFRILPETRKQIRTVIPTLQTISPERMRDEIFRILDGPHQAVAVQIMQRMDMVSVSLPGMNQFPDFRIQVLRQLERILGVLDVDYDQEMAANWTLGLLVVRLGRYRKQFQDYFKQYIVPGRNFSQLLYLCALSLDKPVQGTRKKTSLAEDIAFNNPLELSKRELEYLHRSLNAVDRFRDLTLRAPIAFKAIYQYFREYQDAGVFGILLGLASFLAVQGNAVQTAAWPGQLKTARTLLEAWWEQREERVSPPRLLDGNDLQAIFSIAPGPQIGHILEKLQEAQAVGLIASKAEAEAYVREMMTRQGEWDHPRKN